jgi:hypothetical protein
MANLHSQFKKFEEKISLSKSKNDIIVKRHSTLRKVITDYFKQKEGVKVPDFYIQGSYKMNTMVQKKDGSFDVDLGVFLSEKPSVSSTTTQTYVLNAVKNQTTRGAEHLKKCIRLNYTGEFNADLPVYYQLNANSQAYIAVKNGDWVKDDPEQFIKWVKNIRKLKEIDNDGQLIRVIKFLKRWANLLPFKTPSGIALTVWACNNFIAVRDRDDESFFKTIQKIYSEISWFITCKCPVEPFDDLLSKLDSVQKDKFKAALKSLNESAEKAIKTTDVNTAVLHWAKHFGEKFN